MDTLTVTVVAEQHASIHSNVPGRWTSATSYSARTLPTCTFPISAVHFQHTLHSLYPG